MLTLSRIGFRVLYAALIAVLNPRRIVKFGVSENAFERKGRDDSMEMEKRQ